MWRQEENRADEYGTETEYDIGLPQHESTATAVRDTAQINGLLVGEKSLFVSASNGSIREWAIEGPNHSLSHSATLWEHSRWVNGMVLSHPSVDVCQMHGIPGHQCTLVSASDDRSAKLFDTVTRKSRRTLYPPKKDSCVMKSIAISHQQIFVGSSKGDIFVYSKDRFDYNCPF